MVERIEHKEHLAAPGLAGGRIALEGAAGRPSAS
jgi:hypothetical protein